MTFLDSRTTRERWLIFIAAALMCLFLVWQFGARPILSQKKQAVQAQEVAVRDLDIVQRGVPKIRFVKGPEKTTFNRTEMIAAARSANVAISRVQPGSNNKLQVWFEDSESSQIFSLLADLSDRFNIDIDRVQITRRDTGRVSAQVTLAPR